MKVQLLLNSLLISLVKKNMKSGNSFSQEEINHPTLAKDAGFTLLEVLVIVLIVGILSSIAVPGWLAFINNQRLRTSFDRVYQAMQTAQSNAKRDKVSWQVSFRQNGTVFQWAVHPSSITDPAVKLPVSESDENSPNLWHPLEETTPIAFSNNLLNVNGFKPAVIFNRQGCIVKDPADECTDTPIGVAQITLSHTELGNNSRRCIVVDSLLGAMRTGRGTTECP